MSQADGLILTLGLVSFCIFFVLHIVVFRFLKTDKILTGIMNTAVLGGLISLGLSIYFFGINLFFVTLVLAIYGLAVFVYILCIFGPYETSIRMRLVRMLYQAHPTGLTQEELLQNYNARIILDIRLNRLIGAGDIRLEDNRYYLVKKGNMFFLLEWGANQIKKWTASS